MTQHKLTAIILRLWSLTAFVCLCLVAGLLLIATSALPQARAAEPPGTDLPPLAEEPSKGPPTLEWSLVELVRQAKSEATSPGQAAAIDVVRVEIEAFPGQGEAVVQQVAAMGGKVEITYRDLVQALVPVSALEELAITPGVKFVMKPIPPVPLEMTSQGVSLVGANTWQQSGLTGKGVKVAVVDAGFQGYASLLGGELPANPVIRSFRADGDISAGTAHGTACAEIVHDLAPEAQLYLVNVSTPVELVYAVAWLIDQGVNIISHSLGWLGFGTGDGTGPLADMLAWAEQNGILWVNAAGNYAQNHWGGDWRDYDADGWMNFLSTDETNNFFAIAGDTISVDLTWDDPWGASTNNYDLYLYDNNMIVVDSARNLVYASEWIDYIVPTSGTYHVAIRRVSGQKTSKLNLFIDQLHTLEYQVAAGSLAVPADSASALAVGAVPWNNPSVLEDFSSQGPTLDGRTKPDLVAPDGVSTATYGIYPLYGFSGTSAATPHVAGAAALVRQLYPSMTPAQLKDFLRSRATDLGSTGPDNLYGWGRLNLGAIPLSGINLAPAAPTVAAKASQQFTATALAADGVTPVTNVTYTWSVVDFNAGSITASGLFTGGTRAGTYSNAIKASTQGVDGFASVTVAPSGIRITPVTATVAIGASQEFIATALAADGVTPVSNVTFTWSVVNPDAGSLVVDPADSTKATLTTGAAVGTYANTIKASAQNIDGFATVVIIAPVAADFSATPLKGAAPLAVQFTDRSTGSPDTWRWNFGDGATSTQQNPSHIYTTGGIYTVSLVIINSAGGISDTGIKASYIDVMAADFSASPTKGAAPLTVQFNDQSVGSPDKWYWSFGDGGTSTQQNPSYIYTTGGAFTVALTATNSLTGASDVETRANQVNVVKADFTAAPVAGVFPLTVQFTSTATSPSGHILSYAWDLDGDSVTDSIQQSASFTYSSAGSYTVSLAVHDSNLDVYDTATKDSLVHAVSPTSLVAETSLAEEVLIKTDVVRVKVSIDDIKRLDTGLSEPVPGGIASYDAVASYSPGKISLLTVQGGPAAFSAVAATNIMNGLGQTLFNAYQAQSPPQAPLTLARLVPILTGPATDVATLGVDFTFISDASGVGITQHPTQPLPMLTFKRGDANKDGLVTMVDAVFIAQYIANLREASGLGLLNAASVFHDGAGGDKITIVDALFIAQYKALLRDANYNPK